MRVGEDLYSACAPTAPRLRPGPSLAEILESRRPIPTLFPSRLPIDDDFVDSEPARSDGGPFCANAVCAVARTRNTMLPIRATASGGFSAMSVGIKGISISTTLEGARCRVGVV